MFMISNTIQILDFESGGNWETSMLCSTAPDPTVFIPSEVACHSIVINGSLE
jgi:hypothetical protein